VLPLCSAVYILLSLYIVFRNGTLLSSLLPSHLQKNYGGIAGAYISDILMSLIGFTSFGLPVFLLAYGIKRVLGKDKQKIYMLGIVLFIFFGSLMSSLYSQHSEMPSKIILEECSAIIPQDFLSGTCRCSDLICWH